MHLGFTGSSTSITPYQVQAIRRFLVRYQSEYPAGKLHHGDCIIADECCHNTAVSLQIGIILHPPKNPAKRAFCGNYEEIREPVDYLVRNKHIVNESGMLLACPSAPETLRSGTWSTVRYARKLRRPIYIIGRDGKIKRDRINS